MLRAWTDWAGPTPATSTAWSLACYNPEKDPGGNGGRAIVAAMERVFPA